MTLEKEEQLQIRPASEHVGADITDVNLAASLSNGAFEKIEDAYNRYSLLIFRDQELSPAQQIAFARRFGELEISPRAQFALPGYPEILVLSNIIEDGKPIGNADAGRLGTRKPRGITFRTRRIPHLSRLRAEAAGDAHRRGARCGCVALWRQRDARRQCGGRLEHAQRRHLRLCGQTFSCRSTTCTCSPRRCAVRTARRLEHDMKIHTPKAGLAMKLLLRRAEADAIVA